MKVVVNKQALAGFIDQTLNEDRSFHTKNVNELEKSQPQIFPQEQMAQQLTQSKVPVDDSAFEPTNKSELGKAAMQLSDKVSDDKIKEFYASLKKLAKKNSDDPGEINIREARRVIDRMVFEVMSEAKKPFSAAMSQAIANLPNLNDMGDLGEEEDDDSEYEKFLDKGSSAELEDPIERAFDRITDIIRNLSKDERMSMFFNKTDMKAFDDPLAPYLYVPKEDMQEIADDLMRSRLTTKIMEDEGINSSARREQMRKKLYDYLERMNPRRPMPYSAELGLQVAATRLIDMIWSDHRGDVDGFINKVRDLDQDLRSKIGQQYVIWPGKDGDEWVVDVDVDFINRVRGQFLKYLKKFNKNTKKVEVIDEPDAELVPAAKKEKLPTSSRELTVYSEILEALVELKNDSPDEFMKMLKSLGTIEIDGKMTSFAGMTIEDFDDLDDPTKTLILRQLSKDKDLSGKVYRWLQNFERTAGMKMFKDNDYLPSYFSTEVAPGEYNVEALAWKAFPESLIDMFYDTCVKSVINSALIRGFNLEFTSFISSFQSDDLINLRKSIKDVLYNLLLTNRADFENELDVWYEFHDTKNKNATLKKYEKEIEILNTTGFTVSATEVDQYFTNLKSASLDVYHLANGILYSIALKHINELIVKGSIRSSQGPQATPAELLNIVKSAFESNMEFSSFYSMINNQIPMNIKLSPSDMLLTWNDFYNKYKRKIDSGISKKISQTGGVRGAVDPAALNFFQNFINLTTSNMDEDEDEDEDEDNEDFKLGRTVGDDVEAVKETFEDLLNKMLGGSRKGGTTTYSSVPAGIGMMIIKALNAYIPSAPPEKAQVAESALNILTSKDKIKTVGGITINDPKGVMAAKQISASLMETILTKIITSNYKTQRTRR